MSKLKDVVQLAAGQAAAAAGTLLGVRMLTHSVSPETFGQVSLGLGCVALLLATLSTPFTQAMMHLYPSYAEQGQLHRLRDAFHHAARRMMRWIAVPLLAAIAACVFAAREYLLLMLVVLLLLASDVRRSVQVSVLNAAKRHGRYSLWIACDAWVRPLAATAAVLVIGESAEVALAAHLAASLTLTSLFSSTLWGAKTAAARGADNPVDGEIDQLSARMWQYALPLIPVGLISWSNNVSDRFIIGGMLSVDAAGVYAATFGLASAPFIMLTNVLEQAFRPEYQRAVSAGRHADANRQLLRWLVVAIVTASAGVLVFASWREWVVGTFLGPQFRSAMDLMPWIAAGYGLRTVAYAVDRVCYAHGRTRRVLAGQLWSACATIVVTPAAISIGGLAGAAVAVPVCFFIYLCAATWNSVRSRREFSTAASAVTSSPTEPLAVRR